MSTPVTGPSKFLDFPNELLVLIIQLLEPRDFESFRSTNRRIEGLSRSFLGEHQYMKREFSVFENGRSPFRPQDYGRLAGLATAILNEPRIALYIEVVRIINWYKGWPRSMTRAAQLNFPVDALGKVWFDVWENELPESGNTIADYKLSDEYLVAKEGDEVVPLELLLLQLPNVRILELNVSNKDCYMLWSALEYMQSVRPLDTLAKLETIILTDTAHEPRQNDIFRCLLSLPSARFVHVDGLQLDGPTSQGMNEDYEGVIVSGTQSFNVESLFLLNCGFRAKTMYSVLNCMTQLTRFSCVRRKPYDPEIDPYWIRAGLENKSKDTLRSLELVGYHLKDCPDPTVEFRPWHHMGSLHNFSVLEYVTINTGLTSTRRPESGDENSPPWFPTSICEITFHAKDEGTRNSARNRITSFLENELQNLPNLEEVWVKGMIKHDIFKVSDFWRDIGAPYNRDVLKIRVPEVNFYAPNIE